MTIFEFGKWLQEHGSSLTEFVEAAFNSIPGFYKSKEDVLLWVEAELEPIFGVQRNPIRVSLDWNKTPQGYDYWEKLAVSWEKGVEDGDYI